MKSSIYKALIIFFIALFFSIWASYRIVTHYWLAPLTHKFHLTVTVPRGATLQILANRLYAQHLIQHPTWFVGCARWFGFKGKLRYGRYYLPAQMSLASLMRHIVKGKGRVWSQATFIEGWTFRKIRQALADDPNVYHSLQGKTDRQIMTLMGSKVMNPEGLFFPDTYHFVWGNSDRTVLASSYDKMQQVVQNAWRKRAKGLPYKSAYSALIVASLIESETAIDKEKSIIAGVILNRLAKNMRLQIDPTVVYGLGKPYGSKITKRDLKFKTPYNTYRIKGLPPTPIDMPSLSSIEAALHPKKTQFLYYVAKGDGGHKFSKTYKGQLAAIKKYYRERKGNRLSVHTQVWLPSALRLPIINVTSYLMYFLFRV